MGLPPGHTGKSAAGLLADIGSVAPQRAPANFGRAVWRQRAALWSWILV